MWQLDIKVGWTLKNLCFWIVVLEKTLESPLDSKIKPVNPKGNQTWVFIGRTDAEAEVPILWPRDAKSWLIRKSWERLKVGEGDDRGWDGWMTSLTLWTWVWATSGSWRRAGKSGMLQSVESDITERRKNKIWYSPVRQIIITTNIILEVGSINC